MKELVVISPYLCFPLGRTLILFESQKLASESSFSTMQNRRLGLCVCGEISGTSGLFEGG